MKEAIPQKFKNKNKILRISRSFNVTLSDFGIVLLNAFDGSIVTQYQASDLSFYEGIIRTHINAPSDAFKNINQYLVRMTFKDNLISESSGIRFDNVLSVGDSHLFVFVETK